MINGDIVDFLAEDSGDEDQAWTPFIADDLKAAAIFSRIASRDQVFFEALRRFLQRGHRLVFVLGNHDVNWPCQLFAVRFGEALAPQPGPRCVLS